MSAYLNIDAKFLGKEEPDAEDFRLEVNGATVGDCLKQYLATNPPLKKNMLKNEHEVETTTYVFINKNPLISDHLVAVVKPGDEVRFMYAEMHGC
jgi:hypothetical protein